MKKIILSLLLVLALVPVSSAFALVPDASETPGAFNGARFHRLTLPSEIFGSGKWWSYYVDEDYQSDSRTVDTWVVIWYKDADGMALMNEDSYDQVAVRPIVNGVLETDTSWNTDVKVFYHDYNDTVWTSQTFTKPVSRNDTIEHWPENNITFTGKDYGVSAKWFDMGSENSTFYDYETFQSYETSTPVYSDISYSVSLNPDSDIIYKNEALLVDVEGYEKVKIYVNDTYLKTMEDFGLGATLLVHDYAKLKELFPDTESLNIKVEAFKKSIDTVFETFNFTSTLKLEQLDPDDVNYTPTPDDPTGGHWFDDIKQPTPPDNAWDLLGWTKYLIDWVVYAFKIVIYSLASVGTAINDLMGQLGGFFEMLKSFFSFLPVQIVSMIVVGLTLSIIVGVFKR